MMVSWQCIGLARDLIKNLKLSGHFSSRDESRACDQCRSEVTDSGFNNVTGQCPVANGILTHSLPVNLQDLMGRGFSLVQPHQ